MRTAGLYRGRLAPSPTGFLHLGHARSFGVAWGRAKALGGVLLLRVEDLDRARCRDSFSDALMEDLRWLGLEWDGEPVFQSARFADSLQAWEGLVRGGWAYPCTCSRRELAGAPHEVSGEERLYPGTCRRVLSAREREAAVAEGPRGVNWRFRVCSGAVQWQDGGFGPQRFTAGREFGDFVVWRRDGMPAYQLACVVDDAAMGVTEVVRGVDLLLSTARQVLVYRALGLEVPEFRHVGLVVDEHGERLAKRHDALSVRALREAGWSAGEILRRALG